MHLDPFLGHIPHIPDIPGPNFGSNFFFAFFRELSHSDAKNEKKIFGDFCPLGVTPAGVIEFFGSKKSKKFFALFSRFESF